MDEMLKSVVVSSANDCATALAEHVAGSESAFVGMMNQRAQELGLLDTNFVNCTGLDDAPEAAEHLTTAHDIAVISRELLKHDRIRDYTTIWMDTVRDGRFALANTNKLIHGYPGATGLKTGYTKQAMHCVSASAERDGVEYIAVVLHARELSRTLSGRTGAARLRLCQLRALPHRGRHRHPARARALRRDRQRAAGALRRGRHPRAQGRGSAAV